MKGSGTLHGDETRLAGAVPSMTSAAPPAPGYGAPAPVIAVWFRVDARRNAEAARKLFAGIAPGTVLVCDAYAAYKKLVRVLGDNLILSWCWVHGSSKIHPGRRWQ